MLGLLQKTENVTREGLVSFVEKEYKRRLEERRPFELQWRLNIAFIEGNQYVDINPAAMALEEIPKLYWWQEREVFNLIAPNIETRIARLNKVRPILKTMPGTDAQEDIRAAKVGTVLLKTIYNDQGIRDLMGECLAWLESCGVVLFKNIWNPQAGRKVGEILIEIDGNEVVQELYEGDLDVLPVPPMEFFPDSSYRQDIEDCRSVIHVRAYHVDEVADSWGVKVEPEETTVMKLQRSKVGIGGLGYGMGGFHYITSKLKEHVLVKEYWERPSKKFPEGRLIIVANGKLLHYGPLPYPVDDDGKPGLPFTKCDCIKRPGVFWGRTVVERLIPLQRRYNALRNRKAEYLNRCAIGQWVVEEGSVDLDEFEEQAGAPGAVLVYNRGQKAPEMAANPPLPPAFETEEATLLQEFSILSGVSEISRQSKAPPGVKSGIAISLALEQDNTRLSATASNVEQFLIKSGKQWLRLYKAFATGPRTLRVVGGDNLVEVIDWTGADIKSDDVVVEGFSAVAETPAQRRQMVFDLLASGLFNDPETGRITKEARAKILEMIELGTWETGDDDEQLHIAKAERENRKLVQGVLPQAVNYDDHVLHISRHNKFRLTTDYEEIIAKQPEIEQLFQQHVNMHLQFLMAQAQMLKGGERMDAAETG